MVSAVCECNYMYGVGNNDVAWNLRSPPSISRTAPWMMCRTCDRNTSLECLSFQGVSLPSPVLKSRTLAYFDLRRGPKYDNKY